MRLRVLELEQIQVSALRIKSEAIDTVVMTAERRLIDGLLAGHVVFSLQIQQAKVVSRTPPQVERRSEKAWSIWRCVIMVAGGIVTRQGVHAESETVRSSRRTGMANGDQMLRAYALITSLRENLPADYEVDEKWVRQI